VGEYNTGAGGGGKKVFEKRDSFGVLMALLPRIGGVYAIITKCVRIGWIYVTGSAGIARWREEKDGRIENLGG
jgi:hypothetical protein